MARQINAILNSLIANLVAYAASIGITINPNDCVFVPGNLSETDYKLLLLNTVANGLGYEEQLNDAFNTQQEALIAQAPPQIGAWLQYQMLNIFQWNSDTPQIPSITPPNFAPVFNPVIPAYKVIGFCSTSSNNAGTVLIKVAANSGGLPADLDTTVGTGALASAIAFANEIAAPGITYFVSSGNSDWLFMQLDVYYQGAYSSTIFNSVQTAITNFLNSLALSAFGVNGVCVVKLSALENAILSVTGVLDVEFVNVAGRPDYNNVDPLLSTFGTGLQQFLVQSETEIQRSYTPTAGYIQLENGESSGTPSPVPNSKLSDYRAGSSTILNLNCIPQ